MDGAFDLAPAICQAQILLMESSIEMDPRVCAGKPVIRGTRIPVAMILEQLAENESWESLLRGYPELTRADIQAALHYAKDAILHSDVIPSKAA